MPIPDRENLSLALLRLLADGQEHAISACFDDLARRFKLTPEERTELKSSGRQSLFENRVEWASFDLVKAGLLARRGRGKIRITDRGLRTIRDGVSPIDTRYLCQFPEYRELLRGRSSRR